MEETFDAFIFACDWDKYQQNILIDKENKTIGEWSLDREKVKSVKYAYAYLTNSDKTVVKKFHIDKWEDAQKDKGYQSDWKLCFTYTHTEDSFFEWNSNPVQHPIYCSSVVLDNLPRLNEEQIKINLHKSEVTPKVAYHSEESQKRFRERKPRSSNPRKRLKAETTREKLSKVYIDKFKDKFKFTDFSAIPKLEEQVEQGQEPEAVLTDYFNSLKK
jgi:hypothetical protein|tara:strand:+ start:831 stop:1478 length:648 start_codon:yes stop_codon:yes gene_type:complete